VGYWLEVFLEGVQVCYERNGGGTWWATLGTPEGVMHFVYLTDNVCEEPVQKNVYR